MKEDDVRPGMLVKTNGAVYHMKSDYARRQMGVKASMTDFREENTYGVVLSSISGFFSYWCWVVEHVVNGTVAVYYTPLILTIYPACNKARLDGSWLKQDGIDRRET